MNLYGCQECRPDPFLLYGNKWYWNHLNKLLFNLDTLGSLQTIDKGGVLYKEKSAGSGIFWSETYKIARKDTGWRWEDTSGNWKEYDSSGRMTAYGSRTGAIGKLLYEQGANGKLIGAIDRGDRQVVWYEYNVDGKISAVRDALSRRAEYTYTGNLITSVKDVLNQSASYEYDGNGRITTSTDPAGRSTIATYDAYGNVTSVKDASGKGHTFEFDYDEGKREYYARVTTTSGLVKEIWYDRDGATKRVDVNGRTLNSIVKDGRSETSTDEKGNITRRDYDEWDNLTKVTYPDGATAAFEYDLRFNKVKRAVDPLGVVTTYEYDAQGNLTRKTDAVGTASQRVTDYTYDGSNQLLTAETEADSHTTAAQVAFTYDGSGNIATITDPEGNTTQFTSYGPVGNPLAMRDGRNNTRTYGYDAMGKLTSVTDPLSHATAFEYDGANTRTAVVNALLKRFSFEYDDHNNLMKATDPAGKFLSTAYNSDNLPTLITDQEGKTTRIAYDSERRILYTEDGAGNRITYHYDTSISTFARSDKPVSIDYPTYTRQLAYDRRQRVIGETDVLDASTSRTRAYTYDAVGKLLTSTDEEGRVTRYEFDPLGRLIRTTDPAGGITERTWDNRGNLISLKDAGNNTTRYEYDRNNRLKKIIRPSGAETLYEYDASGNRTTATGATGRKVANEYDEANRLLRTKTYASGSWIAEKTTEFSYDAANRLLTWNDGTISSAYTYDDLGRKLTETVNHGAFSLGYGYTYWANGLKKTLTGPDNVTYTYSYDEANRLGAIDIPGRGPVTFNVYTWRSPARVTLPGGTSTDTAYDPLMQVKTISAKDPGENVFLSRNYQYSPAGNITTKSTEHGEYTYGYDNLYRLSNATNPSAQEAYTYDVVGNRLTSNTTTGSWSYNTNNELQGYDDTTYVHDADGNITRKTAGSQVVNYVYDPEGRLIEVRDASDALIAKYTYDPFGRRLTKEVSGQKTYYHYSDEGLIGEYDATGTEIRTYGYRPDSWFSTDPVFQKSGGQYYFYQNDHLGTPQKLITSNGSVVWSATYDSFGNAQVSVSAVTNNLRFAGQYFDAETGLHYNLNRYYDPTTGRYLGRDPLGQGVNHYAYAFNNPLSFIDPEGLCALGAGLGSESAQWYADGYNETGDWYYYVGGLFASLWTHETWLETASTLFGGWGASKYFSFTTEKGTEIVERAMLKAELQKTLETGLLRGGREGVHYVSDAVNTNALRAQQRLALPNRPEVRVRMEVQKGLFSEPSRVSPFKHPKENMGRC